MSLCGHFFFLLYTEKLFQAVGDNAQWETL